MEERSTIQEPQSTNKFKKIFFIIAGIVFVLLVSYLSYSAGLRHGSSKVDIPPTETGEMNKQATASPVATAYISETINPGQNSKKESIKSLTYSVPAGWTTMQSGDKTFEVAYDPQIYKATATSDYVTLNLKEGYQFLVYTVNIRAYDGGSRHQFLYKQSSSNGEGMITDRTYEKNYTVNGKSGLCMYNVDLSMTNILCMVVIDSNRAFYIAGGSDEESTEKLLQGLRIL